MIRGVLDQFRNSRCVKAKIRKFDQMLCLLH
jgi:hypothetical protein